MGSEDVVSVNTTVLDARKLSTRDLSDVCSSVPFMAAHRLIVVEGLLKRFQSGEKQARSNGNGDNGDQPLKEWQAFSNYIKTMPPTTVLVLFETDLDPKVSNSLLKTLSPVADNVFQLNELKGREL